MSSYNTWTYSTIAVLTGLGAGYLIALLTTRQSRRQLINDSELVQAITSLSAEVVRLREVLQTSISVEHAQSRQRSVHTVASTSDFMSARSESIDSEDDEFFDTTPASSQNTDEGYLDEQGRGTQASEAVCVELVEEIRQRLESNPRDIGLLWRLARALTHQSMHNQSEPEKEKELLLQAADYSKKAIDTDESCWQAHQWYATAIGSMSKFQGTQQKIKQGYEYKEHIDRAISLNPNYATLHYLAGRWCYEVAGLSWLERKAAAALFATPPEATYEETLQCFMKAEEMNPNKWKINILMIAKCHIKLRDVPSSIEWLRKAYNLPTVTPEDETSQRETEELLLQYDDDYTP